MWVGASQGHGWLNNRQRYFPRRRGSLTIPAGKFAKFAPSREAVARRPHSHRRLGSSQVIGYRRKGESVPKAPRFIG